MAKNTTYEKLKQRVKELEKELAERKQTEETLRESASMLQNILEKAADGICVCHNIPEEPFVRFTHWNPRMTAITGYTMEEINQLGWYQTMYPDPEVQRRAIERMGRMRARDNILAEEWVITTKNGEEKPLSISTSIVKEEDGKVHVLAIMQDITDRKRAEEDLEVTNKRLNYLLTATSIAIYTSKISGDYGATSITENVKQIMGYESREFIEDSSFWIDHVHPDDRQRILNELPIIFEQGSHTYEYRFQHKDGTYRWVLDDMRLIWDEFKKPIEIVGYWIDITQQKQAEENIRRLQREWESIFDAIGQPTLIIDPQHGVIAANRAILKAVGKSFEELLGKKCYEVFHGTDKPPEGCPMEKMMSSGHLETIEMEMEALNGTFLVSCTPLLDDTGKLFRVIHIATDITERKRGEEALRTRTHQLEVVRGVIEEITHELNLDRLLRLILSHAVELTGAEGGMVGLWDESQRMVLPRVAIGEFLGPALMKPFPSGKGVTGQVAETRKGLIVNDYRSWSGARPVALQTTSVTATLAEPMLYRDKLIGVINLAHTEGKRQFKEDDLTILSLFAGQAAIAIENARLYEEVRQELADRVRAEEALRESEEKYRSILENIAEGYYEVDLAGNLTFFNDSVCQMMRFPREELMGMNNRQYTDQENAKKLYQTFNQVYKTGRPTEEFGWEIIRKDGAKRFVGASISLIKDSKGQPGGFRGIVRDITERKAAQEVIQRERDFSEFAINAIPGVFYIFDENGKFLRWNKNLEGVTGYTAAEIANQTPFDHLREDCKELVAERIREVYSTGYSEVEAVLVSKSGKETPYWFYGDRVVLDGKPCLIGMGLDISERKQAEEALRLSEEKFSKAFLSSPDSITITKIKDGCFVEVNESHLRTTGHTREEVIGHTASELNLWVDPEDRMRFQQELREKGSVQNFEVKMRSKPGAEGVILMSAEVMDLGGEPCVIAISRNISDRKRAEEALQRSEEEANRLAHENAFIAEIGRIISSTLNIEEVYERFTKEVSKLISFDRITISVINPGEETFTVAYVFGVDLRDSRRGDVLPIIGSIVEEVRRTRSGLVVQMEGMEELQIRFPGVVTAIQAGLRSMISVPLISKDQVIGALHFRSLKINAYTESDLQLAQRVGNQIAGAIANAQLFAEHERSEMEKAALQEQLQQSQKMEAVGRLAGGIAHDFNNLLQVIQGYCDLALMRLKEEGPLKRAIGEINKAGERAATLIRQLLAFSRRQILELEIVNLNDIIRNMDKMLQRLIGEDIELVTIMGGGLEKVRVDPGQMEQVVMNLAVNARDAMLMGGRLILETSNVEVDEGYAKSHIGLEAGSYVMLSVRDTGVGILPEVREHIFEPFFTTKERGKGTGLGLSMVYGIVKQSGGYIGVESELGRGTTFKIYFPWVEDIPEGLEERSVHKEIPRGSETVLVVEDDEGVRDLTSQILKGLGYRVLEASNGEEALDLYGVMKEPIHLILTDVVMPRMSGRELAGRLISLYPEMKILYMSGYTDDTIGYRGVLEEGVSFIQKPFTMEGLAKKVREVLDKGLKRTIYG